jgi:hypothetical protein
MSARPRSVAIIGWLFVAVGIVSLLRQLVTFHDGRLMIVGALRADFWYAAVSAAAATLSGAFILRGANWARWLLGAWLTFHVGLSVLHNAFEVVVHAALAVLVLWLLFRPSAAAWFWDQRASTPSAKMPPAT